MCRVPFLITYCWQVAYSSHGGNCLQFSQVKILIELDWSVVALSQFSTSQSSHAVQLKQSLKCKRWKKLFMPLIHLLNPQKEFFFFLNENARVTSFFTICSCDEWLLVIEKMLKCKLHILSLTEIHFSPLILFSFNWIL